MGKISNKVVQKNGRPGGRIRKRGDIGGAGKEGDQGWGATSW